MLVDVEISLKDALRMMTAEEFIDCMPIVGENRRDSDDGDIGGTKDGH